MIVSLINCDTLRSRYLGIFYHTSKKARGHNDDDMNSPCLISTNTKKKQRKYENGWILWPNSALRLMVMNFWTRQQSGINPAEQSQHSFDSSSFTSDGLLRASQTSPSTTIHLHSHTTDDDGNREREISSVVWQIIKRHFIFPTQRHMLVVSLKKEHTYQCSVRANALSLFYVMTTYSSATKDEDNNKQASQQHLK